MSNKCLKELKDFKKRIVRCLFFSVSAIISFALTACFYVSAKSLASTSFIFAEQFNSFGVVFSTMFGIIFIACAIQNFMEAFAS